MELDNLLRGCLTNENEVRQQAEEVVKRVCKRPDVVPELMKQMSTASDAQIRQLAAVLLRKRITAHWKHLEPTMREEVKAGLLQLLEHEPTSPVRRAIAGVVSVVAKHTVARGEWPGLLEFLQRMTGSPLAEHRELAYMTFSQLMETIQDQLGAQFATFQSIFKRGLGDADHTVRMSAVRAIEASLGAVTTESHVHLVRDLVPGAIEVCRYCLGNDEEDDAIACFELFIQLIETPAPVLSGLIPDLLKVCMEAAMATGLELGTREQALQILSWLARYKPKQLVKAKVLGDAVNALGQLMSEPYDTTVSDHARLELPAAKFSSQVLDALSLNLPAKRLLPEVLSRALPAAASPDARARAAAMTMLAVVAEGAAELAEGRLEELLPPVLAGLEDPDEQVRGAAAYAVGQYCEHLQPGIVEHHAVMLPKLFALLGAATGDTQERAVYALDTLCEHLGEDIMPYFTAVMDCLIALLQNGPETLADLLLSAIASVVSAAGDKLSTTPTYVNVVLEACKHYMQLTADKQLTARARATECAGLLIVGLGKDQVGAIVPDLMRLALAGWDLDYTELKEYGHGMFAHVAGVLQDQFAPYLEHCVPKALETLTQIDGTVLGEAPSDSDSDDEQGAAPKEVDGTEGGQQRISVHTGILDEKSAAVLALGHFAKGAPAAFMPYMERVLPVLKEMAEFFHEDVRCNAYMALAQCIEASAAAFPSPGPGALSPQVKAVADVAFPLYCNATAHDDDKSAVAAMMCAATVALPAAGPLAFAPYAQKLCASVSKVVQGESLCQRRHEDEPEDEELDDDELEEDEILLCNAMELMPAIAETLGANAYAPVFEAQHWGGLHYRMKASQVEGVRATAVGSLGEVGRHIGEHVAFALEAALPALLRELGSDCHINRQNAAYAIGRLAFAAPAAIAPHMQKLLAGLHPLFTPQETAGSTRDNACAAVGRMLLTPLAETLPLGQVVGVLCGALPLTEDFEEAAPVYEALCALLGGPAARTLEPQLPAMVAACGAVVLQEPVAQEVRVGVAKSLAALMHSGHAAMLAPLVEGLPPEQKAALAALAA